MALLRNQEPKVLYSDNGTLSDVSEKLRTWGTPDFSFTWNASQDALYIGKRHKFNSLYCLLSTANENATTMTVSYWNAGQNTWLAFTDLVDETAGFTQDGFIQWEEPATATVNQNVANWDKEEASQITGLTSLTSKEELYWVKVTLSADTTASSIARFCQLLSDDRLLVHAYPEIMQYLPSGETTFLKQHELAAMEIANELIVRGRIRHFDQIKRPDDYLLAASFKTIEIIFRPIQGDERLAAVKQDFAGKAARALDLVFSNLDANQSEALEESETEDDTVMRWQTR
jgi:hypothetical protein